MHFNGKFTMKDLKEWSKDKATHSALKNLYVHISELSKKFAQLNEVALSGDYTKTEIIFREIISESDYTSHTNKHIDLLSNVCLYGRLQRDLREALGVKGTEIAASSLFDAYRDLKDDDPDFNYKKDMYRLFNYKLTSYGTLRFLLGFDTENNISTRSRMGEFLTNANDLFNKEDSRARNYIILCYKEFIKKDIDNAMNLITRLGKTLFPEKETDKPVKYIAAESMKNNKYIEAFNQALKEDTGDPSLTQVLGYDIDTVEMGENPEVKTLQKTCLDACDMAKSLLQQYPNNKKVNELWTSLLHVYSLSKDLTNDSYKDKDLKQDIRHALKHSDYPMNDEEARGYLHNFKG